MKTKIIVVFLFTLSILISAPATAQSPQQTLNQYISDLQNNPNDYALREKIIKHVQTMKQKPTIPREAERFINRGTAAVKSAKDANDFKDAVAEFEKATLSAPWMANAYYNLGVSQDKAGLYAAAIRSLKLYLLAAPNAPDIRNVGKLIDEIEYRQEKAPKRATEEKRARQEAAEANKAREQEDFLRKINGARFVYLESDGSVGAMLNVIGDTVTWVVESDRRPGSWEPNGFTFKIEGRTLRGFNGGRPDPWQDGVITDDGSTITITQRTQNATTVFVFNRRR